MTNARGKYAFGFCDKTGFRYPLDQLVDEYENGVKNGFRVGYDVVDPDQPQNFLGRVRVDDPQSLLNPRPDKFTEGAEVTFPTFDLDTIETIPLPLMRAEAGRVTITGASPTTPVDVTPTGIAATVSLGSPSISVTGNITPTGVVATISLGSPSISTNVTVYTVTVASGTNSYGSGNKYYIAGLSGASPTLTLNEGSTYRFDQSDSSNSGHPLRFSTTANGTHGGGSQYTTGVTTSGTAGSAGAYVQITVAVGAPTLYYYCTNHSGMGGQANTP
jgi:hypothetical protein|tara:strand:+ start:2030 stop:2851 length:822 start_codon:yes stop_codon:yes gene_type:complete